VSETPVSRVYGNIVSPYARKVYLCLEWKGLAFEAIDVLPHADSSPFREISPLGKIPAFEDDQVQICDSSVICDYLETRYPEPSIYPKDPADRARALWIEEYADTRLQDLLLRGIVLERLIKPTVRGEPTDVERVEEILTRRLPPELDYLERLLGARRNGSPFAVGESLSIADLAITTCFINACAADFEVDASRWPRLADYLASIRALPLLAARERRENEYLASLS
jgi:glutathione S-transferase